MEILLAATLIMLKGGPSNAAGVETATPKIEVTKVDFLQQQDIDASHLSTFGIQIGDSMAAVLGAVREYELAYGLKVKPNTQESGFRIEVCDSTGGLLTSAFFENHRVARIEWYSLMRNFIAGSAQELLEPAIGDRDSAIRLRLLGREDDISVRVESGKNSTRAESLYLYDKEGIRIVRERMEWSLKDVSSIENTFVQLVMPARNR